MTAAIVCFVVMCLSVLVVCTLADADDNLWDDPDE